MVDDLFKDTLPEVFVFWLRPHNSMIFGDIVAGDKYIFTIIRHTDDTAVGIQRNFVRMVKILLFRNP